MSRPSILAAIFIKMEPVAGCPFGMSGKSLTNTGESTRARRFTRPARSPIFITPSHSASIPVRPIEISNALFEVSNVESIIAGKMVVSPRNRSFTSATTKAMMKKAIQI